MTLRRVNIYHNSVVMIIISTIVKNFLLTNNLTNNNLHNRNKYPLHYHPTKTTQNSSHLTSL